MAETIHTELDQGMSTGYQIDNLLTEQRIIAKRVAPNIYCEDGRFTARFTIVIDGRKYRTERALTATTIKAAIREHAANQDAHERSKRGLCESPYATIRAGATIETLARAFITAGCPDRDDSRRTGKRLIYLTNQIEIILKYWGRRTIADLRPKQWKDYWEWRKTKIIRGTGDRVTDYDRIVLARIIDWAYSEELCKEKNPFDRNFRTFADPTHCRDERPKDGDELHRIADYLMSDPESEVLAWQFMMECLTGCRTSEILDLRWDAHDAVPQPGPGFIRDNVLWVNRRKGGVNNFVRIHPALNDCIDALRHWRSVRFPKSPWFFPSPRHDGQKHVSVCSLSHALKRVITALNLDGNRTSHGCRAYYVCVRRSDGIGDGEIALELGQRSGAPIILRVYGESLPIKLSWLPSASMRPAWVLWLRSENNIVPMAAASSQ